jgi:3D (Asp-Asp-Asp) domain-containing protein
MTAALRVFLDASLLAAILAVTVSSSGTPAQTRPLNQRTIDAKITAYCLSGTTYTGTPVRPGVVAVDPDWIPLGATISIEGLPTLYTAEDKGVGVRGPQVDLWMESCEDATQWGVHYREVSWWMQ